MHLLIIGAHPDDCDVTCGGVAALWQAQGHHVKFVSVSNGDRGHFAAEYAADRSRLAARRDAEARRAVSYIGAEYECLNEHDGDIYVTPELTQALVRLIRQWGPEGQGPDLVIVNRPTDYHRDHRYTAQAVLDTTYVLTVPLMCPEVRHLDRMPVFAYWHDLFREGGAFRPDVAVPIDSVLETKIDLVSAHESQFFEWLPYNQGTLGQVPADPLGRRALIRHYLEGRGDRATAACRAHHPGLVPEGVRLTEAFQISEYGRQPSAEELARLFPSG